MQTVSSIPEVLSPIIPAYRQAIEAAWEVGVSTIGASSIEISRGRELHDSLTVCDGYGFLPKVYPPGLSQEINAVQGRGLGFPEWSRKVWVKRVSASLQDRDAELEYREVLTSTGLSGMVQNISDVGELFEDAVTLLAGYRHICNAIPDQVRQAVCAGDLTEAKRAGRLGVIFSLTGLPTAGVASMSNIDALLDWVEVWYQMGVRFMHLGYNRRNLFADGCMEISDGGLSDLGRELIERMNRVGIIVDVPHSSRQTTLDAATASRRPIVATHVGCSEIFDHPRCKTDAELKAIADTGGYVGIYAVPGLLGPKADLNLLLRHVRHAVEVVGAEHVAIGTDIGYESLWPDDIRPFAGGRPKISAGGWRAGSWPAGGTDHIDGSLAWTNWPLITVGLLKLGLKEAEVEKIVGGNFLRVLRDHEN